MNDVNQNKNSLEERIKSNFKNQDILIHEVPSKLNDKITNYEYFEEIEKFFNGYSTLFLGEEKVDSILTHLFENFHNKHVPPKLYFPDSISLTLFDSEGKFRYFQKYNNSMIIFQEVRKYKETGGGTFKVTDFIKCKDEFDNKYLQETVKSKNFENISDIFKARIGALKYMKQLVDYYDIKNNIIHPGNVEIIFHDTNSFRINKEECFSELPFDYFSVTGDKKEYEKELEKEEKILNDNSAKDLKQIIEINKQCLRASLKPYFVISNNY